MFRPRGSIKQKQATPSRWDVALVVLRRSPTRAGTREPPARHCLSCSGVQRAFSVRHQLGSQVHRIRHLGGGCASANHGRAHLCGGGCRDRFASTDSRDRARRGRGYEHPQQAASKFPLLNPHARCWKGCKQLLADTETIKFSGSSRWRVRVAERSEAERDPIDRRCSTGKVCSMETAKMPRTQDKDGDETFSFDPTTPPAAVDIHAFARRTGEIIARAARALLGRRVKR